MSGTLVTESQTQLPISHGLSNSLDLLAEGGTADVYEWGDGSVLKLFHPNFPPACIALEMKNSRIAHALGIPTPIAIGHAEWNQRNGIIFERVDGPTFYNLIQTDAQARSQLGRVFFDVQQSIHRCEFEELLPLQAVMAQQIRQVNWLPETLRREAMEVLQRAPLVNTVCHLDFHPLNVVMGASGSKVVDWLNMCRGDPAIDVVRTLLFLRHFRCGVDQGARIEFLNAYVELCHKAWCGRMEQLVQWQRPVAVWRLTHKHITAGERTELLDLLESPNASWF